MLMNVRRPLSNVQAVWLKGSGRPLSAFPTAGQQAPLGKGLRHAAKNVSSNGGRRSVVDEEMFDRRLDELQRRIRRLDERIVRTVATSTPGLLAQLRLLAAFYEESTNGAGRRGSLLIQAIAEGVTQLEARRSRPPMISTGLGTSAGSAER